jgi:anaerobic magnesium-protoporphyrin IX monomethyl ester cyclase
MQLAPNRRLPLAGDGDAPAARAKQPSAGARLRAGNLAKEPLAAKDRARWQPNPNGRVVLFQPRVGYMDSMRSKPALPLSLLHAAALTWERHEVVIIDQRVQPDWRARLERELRARPLLLGITCYTGPMIERALEGARFARSVDPDVPILWGGVHVGLLPEQSLHHPCVDLVARGEGEVTLARLAEVLARGGSLYDVPGLSFLDGDRYVATPAAEYTDVTATPEIPYRLVDIDDYMPLYEGRKSLYLESSRGCPFACTYCYNVYFNDRKWRPQSPERTLERVRYVRDQFGVEDVYFTDDDFFINPKRSRAIVEGLLEIDVTWQVQGSDIICISKMDDEFLALLRDSGFRRFTIGIETGSPRMRKKMQKAGDVALVRRTIERLAPYGFIIYGSFISNTPGETIEDVRQSVELMQALHDVNPNFRNSPFYHYTPFPGTPMFDDAVAGGFAPPADLEGWARFSYEGHEQVAPIGGLDPSFYEKLYLATLFNDRKVDEYTVPTWARLVARAYRPIARQRLRTLYFDWMPEMHVARRFLRGT